MQCGFATTQDERNKKKPDEEGKPHRPRLARGSEDPSAAAWCLLRLEVNRFEHSLGLGQEAVELGLRRCLDRDHQHAIAE